MTKYRGLVSSRQNKGIKLSFSLSLLLLTPLLLTGRTASASPGSYSTSNFPNQNSKNFSLPSPLYNSAPPPVPGQVIVQFKRVYAGMLLQALASSNRLNPAAQDTLIGARLDANLIADQLPEFASLLYSYGVWAADAIIPEEGAYLLKFNNAIEVRTAALRLEESGFFDYTEPDFPVYAFREPNDPLYLRQQWGLRMINAPEAWDITTGSDAVLIAIVDSGIFASHPDMAGKVITGMNFSVEPANSSTNDNNGHGTFVAGIAAAGTNNSIGIAGVDWKAHLLPVKVLDGDGIGTNATIARGIAYAAQRRAQVINVSLGGPERSQVVNSAVQRAFGQGSVVVASVGNNGTGQRNYPAALDNVIGVGAFNQRGEVASFTNFGPELSILAPGSNIVGPWIGATSYIVDSGTSSAAPFVSGAAALMFSVNNNLSNYQVRNILEGTAVNSKPPDPNVPASNSSGVRANNTPGSYDPHQGWGRLNLYAAVAAARNGTYFPTQQGRIQGNIRGIDPGDVQLTVSPGDVRVPERITANDGFYSFSNLPPGVYQLRIESKKYGISRGPEVFRIGGGDGEIYTRDFDLAAEVKTSLESGKPIGAFNALSTPPENSASVQFFAVSGHTVKDRFLKFWQNSGGLPLFGYPISEELTETDPSDGNAYTVQYFERVIFEYHPSYSGTKDEIQLRLLGRELAQSKKAEGPLPEAFAPILPPAAQIFENKASLPFYFYETNHSLSGKFFDYWKNNGGILIFGLPISQELFENGRKVQYFERYRLEIHPEDSGTPWEVVGSLLARTSALRQGYLGRAG